MDGAESVGDITSQTRTLAAPGAAATPNLDLWVKEMKTIAPRTRIVTMKYFDSYAP